MSYSIHCAILVSQTGCSANCAVNVPNAFLVPILKQVPIRLILGGRAALSTVLDIWYGTIPRVRLGVFGLGTCTKSAVPDNQTRFRSESAMADVYLGITVASLYALVAMGLMLAFL